MGRSVGRLASIVCINLAAACFLVAVPCESAPQFIYTCSENEKIDPATRVRIEQSAMRFIELALRSDTESTDRAYSSLTPEARQETSRGHWEQTLRLMVWPMAPFTNLRVQNTYLIRLKGLSAPPQAFCMKELTRPEEWVTVAAKNLPEQAHVIIEGQALNNAWVFVLWLVPEQQEWRVQYFFANASTLAGKSSSDIWLMARIEKTHGHMLNAAVLYVAASLLANRGPNLKLGVQQPIQEEMQQIIAPPELQGELPFLWRRGGRVFKVLQLSPISIGGKIYLVIGHEVEPWTENAQVEALNRELIQFFVARFPEYSEVFAGLVMHGHERGTNRMWGTVLEASNSNANPLAKPQLN